MIGLGDSITPLDSASVLRHIPKSPYSVLVKSDVQRHERRGDVG